MVKDSCERRSLFEEKKAEERMDKEVNDKGERLKLLVKSHQNSMVESVDQTLKRESTRFRLPQSKKNSNGD